MSNNTLNYVGDYQHIKRLLSTTVHDVNNEHIKLLVDGDGFDRVRRFLQKRSDVEIKTGVTALTIPSSSKVESESDDASTAPPIHLSGRYIKPANWTSTSTSLTPPTSTRTLPTRHRKDEVKKSVLF